MKRSLAVLLAALLLSASLASCNLAEVKNPDDTTASTDDSTAQDTEEAEASYDYDLSEYVQVGEYLGIEVEVVSPEVTQSQIDSAISSLLSQNATTNTITDRPAQAGDTLTIDYVGTISDIPFDGGTGSGKSITLNGTGGYLEGFADGLIGASIGSTVVLNLSFPADYSNSAYAGKDCQFTVTVKGISETIMPEFNDAFVDQISEEYTTVAEYTQYLKDAIYTENKELSDNYKNSAIFAKIMDSVTVLQYPEKELNELYDSYISQITSSISAYNLTLEDYVKTYTQFETIEAFQEEIMTEAKAYVAEEMTVRYIINAEDIHISEEEFNQGAAHYAQLYNYGTASALIEAYGREAVEMSILYDKLFVLLSGNAVDLPSETTIEQLIAMQS